MNFILTGLAQAWQLLVSGDPYLWQLTVVTLQVAGISTGVALVLGLPAGLALGLGRFHGRRAGLAVANAGLGLPPVVVGIVLALFSFPAAPLGGLHLLFNINGVFVAQSILALPIVIALTASAVRSMPAGIIEQARAFGVSTPQVAWLALRESRIGILAAIIAAAGAALSEVGAVVLVGGNIEGNDQTLASAALEQVDAGRFSNAFAIGIILLALIALITIVLTLLQYWDGLDEASGSRVSDVLLDARGLTAARDGHEVLHGIDLTLTAGEVVAVIGPNGAGKSTLLATLAGVLRRTSGRVTLGGSIALAMQAPGLARRSSRENVELALGWWGAPRGERRARADAALKSLRASHLADRRATQLSGGEQRRVHLARALALESDILLLDEPFEGLDPTSRAALLEDAGSVLRTRRGATLIVVHDRREAWALADRVVMLFDGRVVGDAAPQELLDHPATPEAARFLGYDGSVRRGNRMLLTRPRNVQVDPAGEPATVLSVTPIEDGFRVKAAIDGGFVFLHATERPAETLRITISGGAAFDD